MFKEIRLICLILSCTLYPALSCITPKNQQKIVAWDIHGVLCTQPFFGGSKCEPYQEMFRIVEQLNKNGVTQVIFSNISKRSFRKLIARFPQLFKNFDITRSIAEGKGIFTRKPYKKYYKKLLNINEINPNNIIFFDDKDINIKNSHKLGIDGHIFYNVTQAKEVLKQNNLL